MGCPPVKSGDILPAKKQKRIKHLNSMSYRVILRWRLCPVPGLFLLNQSKQLMGRIVNNLRRMM